MREKLQWEEIGPLDCASTKDRTYWTFEVDGKYLAWFMPEGFSHAGNEDIGEFATLVDAQTVCQEHADERET